MPHLRNKARPVRALLVTALMGALLAVVPSYASAQTPPPMAEQTTNLSACVGDALESYGFTDIGTLGDNWQDAINCLAYYGITVGTTATTYSPASNVTRGQMALFLYRSATAAGIDINAETERAAMFADIGDLGDEWQTAIKALYSHNIMSGRQANSLAGVESRDTFVPGEAITRAEMAHYLRNLVRVAQPDMFNDDGELEGVSSLDHFPDARTSTPGHVNDAIAEAYELGITVGTSLTPREFSPAALVTRSQMALFITRTLAHTVARPVGLTVQQDGAKVVVSIRDRDYQPVEDEYVDMFVADIEDEGDAFDDDGDCNTRAGAARESETYPNSDVCEIDWGDEITDETGDVEFNFGDELTSDGLAVWVWTGDIGDEATADDVHLTRFAGADLPLPSAKQLTVSYEGVATNADGEPWTARRGRSVTVKVQLQGHYEDEPNELVDVPADGRVVYSLKIDAETLDDSPTDIVKQLPVDLVLDAEGSAEFSIPNNFATYEAGHRVTFTLTPDPDSGAPDAVNAHPVVFSSADPVATSVAVEPHSVWRLASTTDSPIRNQVTVTVSDQYGRRVSSAAVTLTSNRGTEENETDAWDQTRTTSPRSPARIIYTYSGDAAVETLIAGVDNDDPADGLDTNCADPDTYGDSAGETDVCGTAMVYWVTEADDMSDSQTYVVKHVDLSNEAIIVQVGSAAPLVVRYTDPQRADRFSVNNQAPRDSSSADLAEFEAALALFNAEEHTWSLTWDKPDNSPWEFNLVAPDLMMG